MALNLNIGNVSISGLETVTTEQLDNLIDYIQTFKKYGKLKDEEQDKYIFRAKFIHLLVNFLIENKVKLLEEKLSSYDSSYDFIYNIPDDTGRYRYLLNDNKFSVICSRLLVNIIAHTPPEKEQKEQNEKSLKTLLKLKNKV